MRNPLGAKTLEMHLDHGPQNKHTFVLLLAALHTLLRQREALWAQLDAPLPSAGRQVHIRIFLSRVGTAHVEPHQRRPLVHGLQGNAAAGVDRDIRSVEKLQCLCVGPYRRGRIASRVLQPPANVVRARVKQRILLRIVTQQRADSFHHHGRIRADIRGVVTGHRGESHVAEGLLLRSAFGAQAKLVRTATAAEQQLQGGVENRLGLLRRIRIRSIQHDGASLVQLGAGGAKADEIEVRRPPRADLEAPQATHFFAVFVLIPLCQNRVVPDLAAGIFGRHDELLGVRSPQVLKISQEELQIARAQNRRRKVASRRFWRGATHEQRPWPGAARRLRHAPMRSEAFAPCQEREEYGQGKGQRFPHFRSQNRRQNGAKSVCEVVKMGAKGPKRLEDIPNKPFAY
eukprot:scaffold754_cov248-Pinguiococcus_pyrenoidosus.AAC.40